MAAVVLEVPRRSLFVGSFARVKVDVDPASGLTFDDLQFFVDGGPPGGAVSLSRDETFDPARPKIMLLAGYEPGEYTLQAVESASGSLVGETAFKVTTSWRRDKAGPSRWFMGRTTTGMGGSAWGGGGAGPQNINVMPARGTWRVAILFVDTTSRRYSTNATTLLGFQDRWMDETVNGVTSGGVTRSVAHFYREVSYGNLNVSAQTFGPVSLNTSWDNNFNADSTPKAEFFQRCITAGDSLIDYRNFDTVVCISQSVPASGSTVAKMAWPWGSYGKWGPYSTSDGNVNIAVISVPNEWGQTGTRTIHEILSHELGHSLGMGDMYNPGVPGRNVGNWDLMDSDDPLPHVSLVHRMMLGWVDAGWLRTFNFSSIGGAVDQMVSLSPIELGAPPSGRKIGIEVRLANGWNYYFEYRKAQSAHIGDRTLPTDSRVLGIDAVSPPWTAPVARPFELLLNNDIDGDGAVLGNGADYEERDTSDPMFPTDFTVDVSGIDGSKADVRVRYGVNSRPDPSIRPWPAGVGREWQSPDIEVRNARNAADSAWFNVPWEGNMNTVVAKVKNNSGAFAPGVRVNFFVKDFTLGGVPDTFLGSSVQDIGPNATVEFSTAWTPPSQGHFCIVVRIPLYQVPSALSVVELTELNNMAQSNYDRYISRTASVATREMTSVTVGNPHGAPARVFLVGGQTNPVYRTYLEHTWLLLDPGETRSVRVMFEYAPTGDKRLDEAAGLEEADIEEFAQVDNDVGIHAVIEDPRDVPAHAMNVLGGAQAQVVTGRATEFSDFDSNGRTAEGGVVTADDKEPVTDGLVIVRGTSGRGEKRRFWYWNAELERGRFLIELGDEDWDRLRAFYVPDRGLADCASKVLSRS